MLKPACTQLTRYGVLYSNGDVVSGDFASVRRGCDQSLAYERNILVHTHKFRFLKAHQVMAKMLHNNIDLKIMPGIRGIGNKVKFSRAGS